MLFMFFTMLRKSNVLPQSLNSETFTKVVKRSQVLYTIMFLLVSITSSKTIQYSDRVLRIPISAIPGSHLCPVQAYRSLLSMVTIQLSYPAFCYNSSGMVIPLTYSVFVKQFRAWLSQIGVSCDKLYCTHSFRRGGATFAFQSGVSPNLIKCQGDWKSDCYLKYVKLNVSDKIVTTSLMAKSIRNMGL